MADPLTTDDINVRVTARLSASIVVGLYDGPITHRVVAENLAALLGTENVETVEDLLDSFIIDAIETDGGMTLVASEVRADG